MNITDSKTDDLIRAALRDADKKGRLSVVAAVSGIAGPDGGSVYKPVGTVCFGFYLNGNVASSHLVFAGDRQQVRQQAIDYALKQSIELLTALAN